jgi:hypothetical protein
MKRVAICLTAVVLSACINITSGIFAHVDVACGTTALIYSNAQSKIDEKINVKAIDRCSGVDSEVQLLNEDGKIVERFPIPDGTTKTVKVVVRSGHFLNFVCNGTSGSCSYSVTSE